MRRLLPLIFFLALLPLSPVSAQALTCQTPNGPKLIDNLIAELRAAGYVGPWDVASEAAAYGRAAGGLASCGAAPVDGKRQAVLFVGGVGSTTTSSQLTFATLADELVGNWGYSRNDLQIFQYGLGDNQDPSLSCEPPFQSIPQLLTAVRSIKAMGYDGVVLLGHSNGGVVALQTADQHDVPLAASGAQFIRRVITVDSPLNGVSGVRALLRDLWDGPCPAVDGLSARFSMPQIIHPWIAEMARHELDRGVQVFAVTNPEDFYVPTSEQGIDGVPVNFTVDVVDGSFSNHAAVFKTQEGAKQLAGMIGRQGS